MVTYAPFRQTLPVCAFRKKTPISVREVRKKSAGFYDFLVVFSQGAQFHIIGEKLGTQIVDVHWRNGKVSCHRNTLLSYPGKLLFTLHTLSQNTDKTWSPNTAVHCANNIYAHWLCSDAWLWCIDGRPAPSRASWLRAAAPGLGCREEEEEGGRRGGGGEKSTFSTAWMDSNRGGREGKLASKGIWRGRVWVNRCKHKADEGMKTFMWADSAEWVTHETKYEVGLKDWQWRKIWKHGCVQC